MTFPHEPASVAGLVAAGAVAPEDADVAVKAFALPAGLCRCDDRRRPVCPCGEDSLCDGCDDTAYGQEVAWVRINFARLQAIDPTLTDAGGAGTNGLVRAGGVAYITGEPAMASLTAKIRGLPDWIETAWRGNLTTERTERRTRDDRVLVATNILGAAAFDINAALTNETVGGKCVLQSRVDARVTGTHEFSIRGKNPLDATARAYITANVDEEFRSYAWKIAKHETIVGVGLPVNGVITNGICYNQFNPIGRYKELPDFGSPDGWGIGQIDRSRNRLPAMNYTTTKEVYDWHESVASMNQVLRTKRNRYLQIVGWFRTKYQNDPSVRWVEPNVTTNLNGVVLSARDWSIITLYNGTEGCDKLTVLGRPRVGSPIHFDPQTSSWRLSTNVHNYAPNVFDEADAEETE